MRIATVLTSALLWACGGAQSQTSPLPRVEGVPVPDGGKLLDEQHWSAAESLNGKTDSVSYELSDLSASAALAFYEQQMPRSAPFGEWTFCREDRVDTTTYLLWKRGSLGILSVVIGGVKDGAVVVASADESGPCRDRAATTVTR